MSRWVFLDLDRLNFANSVRRVPGQQDINQALRTAWRKVASIFESSGEK